MIGTRTRFTSSHVRSRLVAKLMTVIVTVSLGLFQIYQRNLIFYTTFSH